MTKRFTGAHMLALMLGFFGVIIAVNATMATLAARTFGGKVVENSYVASQRFNGWLAEARAQERLGFATRIGLDRSRHVTVDLRRFGGAVTGARVVTVARHPVGRAADVALAFDAGPNGVYRSATPLPRGRWNLHFEIRADGRTLRLVETLA